MEDNTAASELMLHALKKAGFESESEVVQTAAEFAERLRGNRYDIILADYRLPGWNGLETVRMLREADLDIPVVLGIRRSGRTESGRMHQAGSG